MKKSAQRTSIKRKWVLKRLGAALGEYKCFYCNQPVRDYHDFYLDDHGKFQRKAHLDEATIDHIVPLSKGGSNLLSNLVLACYQCNSERSDTDYLAFKAKKLAQIKEQAAYQEPSETQVNSE
jgi:5-methylcytosine-specific restriction endonuclease McrA